MTYAFNENARRSEQSSTECSADVPWPSDKNTFGSKIISVFCACAIEICGIKDTNLRQCDGVSKMRDTYDGLMGWHSSNIGRISWSYTLSNHNLASFWFAIPESKNLWLSFWHSVIKHLSSFISCINCSCIILSWSYPSMLKRWISSLIWPMTVSDFCPIPCISTFNNIFPFYLLERAWRHSIFLTDIKLLRLFSLSYSNKSISIGI